MKKRAEIPLRMVKKWITILLGMSILLVGILLIFLPGPAVVVIPLGVLILSKEFIWARHLLRKIKKNKKIEKKN